MFFARSQFPHDGLVPLPGPAGRGMMGLARDVLRGGPAALGEAGLSGDELAVFFYWDPLDRVMVWSRGEWACLEPGCGGRSPTLAGCYPGGAVLPEVVREVEEAMGPPSLLLAAALVMSS